MALTVAELYALLLPRRWPPHPGFYTGRELARLESWRVGTARGLAWVYKPDDLGERETAADRMAFNLADAYRPEGVPEPRRDEHAEPLRPPVRITGWSRWSAP